MNKLSKSALSFSVLILLAACGSGTTTMTDRTEKPCGDSPRCVSTQDHRETFSIAPFQLAENVSIDDIERVALSMPRAKTGVKESNYLRIEYTSKIMRFVDDMELKIKDGWLLLRSESRIGYSDFGVNRKRAEALRSKLIEAGLVVQS
ncbi:DUF1499 domain-containing protein [Vibrio sp. ZSDZ34]|jgi:uncharacterized protein (DUF1499 family)|uniref:DUF1499 domain-containing protein n=1 Tax=Vibrio gelatinilyticus TaxID=2893468 RepID=A0A9X1WC35_9VIBR|nr:DUF1499 domain-containing protein [Vibrio gelatinilyticus]MCJ2375900.1 DUF1499 domain-containing protein [Vibrio gelatinilyticus]